MGDSQRLTDLGATLALGLAAAVCCGGPLVVAALAATGAGAWVLGQQAGIIGALILLAASSLGLFGLRRRGQGRTPCGDDRCAPAAPSTETSTR